jgi:hypothetical protein
MKRRHATIPPRRRIFLGCEGESEQGYGALLTRIAEGLALHLAPQVVLLRPGGGDPLALVRLAIAKSREEERKRGAFSIKAVLLDQDKLGQSPERDGLLYDEAARNELHLIWQEPSHEALLLRHLPGCQNLRPATTLLAQQELLRRWPEYRKPMSSMRLASRIGVDEVTAACGVEPSLCDFLRRCGLLPNE